MLNDMQKGAIILRGGKSSRMGRDKATLPFGPEVMLQRVVRLISNCVPSERIVIVAAHGQALPAVPSEIKVARDARESRGPMEGLAAGLRALGNRGDAVYATACDVPLLVPAFVDRMFDLLSEFDAAVPVEGQHCHPLAAVYRTSVLPNVQKLLDSDQRSLKLLLGEIRTREIPSNELRSVDRQLLTLRNINRKEDYEAALTAAGL
jgi:molybdopterin-guanine dinucleotide biosynthesis protein A